MARHDGSNELIIHGLITFCAPRNAHVSPDISGDLMVDKCQIEYGLSRRQQNSIDKEIGSWRIQRGNFNHNYDH